MLVVLAPNKVAIPRISFLSLLGSSTDNIGNSAHVVPAFHEEPMEVVGILWALRVVVEWQGIDPLCFYPVDLDV